MNLFNSIIPAEFWWHTLPDAVKFFGFMMLVLFLTIRRDMKREREKQ